MELESLSQSLQEKLKWIYEIESSVYDFKRKAAEDQLELAKDMCKNLKKKRRSLVGAIVSIHGCGSYDDGDRSINEAKTALLEVIKDFQERTACWRQIEIQCGFSIIRHNPGINQVQNLVRSDGQDVSCNMVAASTQAQSSSTSSMASSICSTTTKYRHSTNKIRDICYD